MTITVIVTVLLLSIAGGAIASVSSTESYLGPLDLVVNESESLMYIALEGLNKVLVWDLEQDLILDSLIFDDVVHALALSHNQNQLIVLTGSSQGKVIIIDSKTLEIENEVNVGHTPVAAVVSPQGDRLYVANRFTSDIMIFDLNTWELISTVAVLREPISVKLSLDGKYLFVGNHLPIGPANTGSVAASVSVIDTEIFKVEHLSLPNGSTGLRGMAISPDGEYIYLTHGLSRYQYPITQLDRGWVNTSAVSVIDVANQSYLETFLLDSVDLGAPNPWAISCSNDGHYLLVTHAGSHELSIIDRNLLHDQLTTKSARTVAIQNDLTFLYGMRVRVSLPGNGPRSLAVVDDFVYIAEYFSDTLAKVSLNMDAPTIRSLALTSEEIVLSLIRRGELIFNDATIAFQQWQSCASCHFDARMDGLTWDQLNDGIGSPSITANLVVSYHTPPTMVTGIVPTAEIATRDSLGMVSDGDAMAVDQYLKTLKPVMSPHLVDGQLSDAAKRGEVLFMDLSCVECHSGPYYTDGLIYDVGSKSRYRENTAYVTPSLIETWRTAPYFHDGRTDSLHEVVEFFVEPLGRQVTSEEIDDLVEYILTL